MDIEKLILNKLFTHELYARKYISNIKPLLFENDYYDDIIAMYKNHINTYNEIPKKAEMLIHLKEYDRYENYPQREKIDKEIKKALKKIFEFKRNISDDILNRKTEEFVKERELHLALEKSINIYDEKEDRGKIPEIINNAMGISFDDDLGTDFLDVSRLDDDEKHGTKIPFRDKEAKTLNKVTMGGAETQALNVIAMRTGGGKTRFMCWLAQQYIKMGYDVLYITLELSEKKAHNYIDSAFFHKDITTLDEKELKEFRKEKLLKYVEMRKAGKIGNIKVKKFPVNSISCLEIENFMNKARLRQGFKPQIVMIDYIQVLQSYRAGRVPKDKTHIIYAEVVQEMRNIAEKYDVCVWTGSQFNKEGAKSSEMDIYDFRNASTISETVDFALGGHASEEDLDEGIINFKVLKTRYAPKSHMRTFVMGINELEMRFFDMADDKGYDATKNKPKKLDKDDMKKSLLNIGKKKRRKKKKTVIDDEVKTETDKEIESFGVGGKE